MRILAFSSQNSGGGSRIKLIELITGLADRGWDIHYISPKDFKRYKNINHYTISVFSILTGYFYVIQITLLTLYLIYIKKNKYERIVAFSILEGFIAWIINKLSMNNGRVIVSLRADWYAGVTLNKWNSLYKKTYTRIFLKVEQFTLKNVDFVIFVSKEMRDRIKSRAKINGIKTKIIYNSIISPRTIEFGQVEKADIKENIVIGFVGNLYAEDKGVEVLIRAFKKVAENVTDIKLVIVGDGPDKEYLHTLCIDLNIAQKILFTGHLNNPFPYIKSFDLLVQPSLHEGFSGVILEALYCDKVVIGSNIGSIQEALKYENLLFEPKDIDGLASKIESMFTNEELYQNMLMLCKSRKETFTFDWIQEMEKSITMDT